MLPVRCESFWLSFGIVAPFLCELKIRCMLAAQDIYAIPYFTLLYYMGFRLYMLYLTLLYFTIWDSDIRTFEHSDMPTGQQAGKHKAYLNRA